MILVDLTSVIKEKNIKPEQLVKISGISRQTVATLVSGMQPARVELSTLNKLCNALKCTPNDILKYTPD